MKHFPVYALAAVGTEPTSGAPAVPPPPPAAVKAMFDAAAKSATDAANQAMNERGVTSVVASVRTWKPFIKVSEQPKFDPNKDEEVLDAAGDERVEVLPPVRKAKLYEERDPVRGALGIRAAQYLKAHFEQIKSGRPMKQVIAELVRKGALDPFVVKALQEQTNADGGALIPPQFSSELIPLLRAATVLLKMGVKVVSMNAAQLIYGRQNAPATANYVGETMVAPYSQAKTGQLKLSTKKLIAITAITDELLEDAGPAADEFIRNDLVRVIALRMDLAGLRGDGTQETPMGLLNQILPANKFAATQAGAVALFTEVNTDLTKMVRLVEESNVPLDGLGWVFAPRVKNFLLTLLNAQGFYVFRDEMLKGTLMGKPFAVTTAIPVNLGAGFESEIYFGAFPTYLLGQRDEVVVSMVPGGAFNDATGAVVSGFSAGLTPVKAVARHDFQMEYTNAFSLLSTCKYGA